MKNFRFAFCLTLIALLSNPQSAFSQQQISIDDMPDAFFQHWKGEGGIWWFDAHREFFGSDNKLWDYESITREGENYTLELSNVYGQTKTVQVGNISSERLTTVDGHHRNAVTLGPMGYDISFREVKPSELPEHFYGTWSSSFGSGETVKITRNDVSINRGEWKLDHILFERGHYRFYLKKGDQFFLWLPHFKGKRQLRSVFNRDVQLTRQG